MAFPFPRRWLLPHVLLTFAVAGSPGLAKQTAPGQQSETEKTDTEHSAEAKARPAEMPLSPLPEPPTRDLPSPRPRAMEAIDELLARIVSEEPLVREKTHRQLLEAKRDWVSGLSRRIDSIADKADRSAMKATLQELIERARDDDLVDESGATEDYLKVALTYAEPDSPAWRHLTQLLAVSRMLRHIESAPAARQLIRIYVRFGEFMRIDTQRQLTHLQDKATAALIEAQRHDAQKIARWAERRLDLRGQAIAHQAVRTEDDQALADILVALGWTRDPDATRILISFAGTQQSQIRNAARQGLALMGEVAAWQLRDAYLDITGKRPPREWTWKRTARELFTEYDRLRLEEVFEHFEKAQAARKAGNLKAMKAAYDRVLSLSPLFEQRDAMAEGYLQYARSIQDSDPHAATLALRRAERISDDDEQRRRAESLRYVLRAEELRAAGLHDRGLYDKAIALDPTNEKAKSLQLSHSTADATLKGPERYAIAWLVAGLAIVGAGFILLRGAKKGAVEPPLEDDAAQRRMDAPGAPASETPGPDTTESEPAADSQFGSPDDSEPTADSGSPADSESTADSGSPADSEPTADSEAQTSKTTEKQ